MTRLNLLLAVFVRRGNSFGTEQPILGNFGMRDAVLDRNSHTNLKPGETWFFNICGANKVDPNEQPGPNGKKRRPLYFVKLVRKAADAPALKDVVSQAQPKGKKKQDKKPATVSDAEARARALFAPASSDTKNLANLGHILGSQRAKTDATAIGIAGGIGAMERMLETNRADEDAVMSSLALLLEHNFDEGLKTVRKLAEARKEKESILADGRKHASACSQAKRISGKGEELPAHLTEAALADAKSKLDSRRDALKALLADERTGKVCTILNKLDREVLEFIEPLWSDWQESKAKVDTAVNAVNDLERIARERSEHLDTLAELVNQYETRLAELVA